MPIDPERDVWSQARLLLGVLVLTASAGRALAQPMRARAPSLEPFAEARLVGDVGAGEGQGIAVALTADGTGAIVGATSGVVSFFTLRGEYWTSRGTWRPHARGPARSVDVDAAGSIAVVGLPDHSNRDGCVLVLVREERRWAEQAVLRAPVPAAAMMFGRSVAIASDGSRVAVGAPRHADAHGRSVGAVYVYARSPAGWRRDGVLTSASAGPGSELGLSVDVSADGAFVLAGAPGQGLGSLRNAGAAHVFALGPDGWAELASLRASDPARGDRLGTSVSLDDPPDRAVIGAPGDDVASTDDAGSARIFVRRDARWDEVAVLAPAAGAGSIGLGHSVAIASGRAVVGSRGGVVVAEDLDAPGTSGRLLPARSGPASFGAAVALSADGLRALVGAPGDDPRGASRAGSAQVFALTRRGSTAALPDARLRLAAPRVLRAHERALRVAAREAAAAERVIAQAGVGVMIAGLAISAELAFLSELRSPYSCTGWFCIDSGHVFAAIGLVLVPLGSSAAALFAIAGTGAGLRGRGRLGWTAVGYLGGAALGAAVVVGADLVARPGGASSADYEPLMLGAMSIAAVLAMGGAILAYTITDQAEQSRHDEPDLVPIVRITPHGGSLGASGRF